MGEIALRIAAVIVGASVEFIGYYTARVLVPFVTFGRYRVATPRRIYELWSESNGDGIHPALAATLGIVFWLGLAVGIALAFAFARA